MDKAVLISIRPKWCEKIANGQKTIEVRKTKPKLQTPFKCYIYCTQSDLLTKSHNTGQVYVATSKKYQELLEKRGNTTLSGKVIGEFICDSIIPISVSYSNPNHPLSNCEFPFTGLTDKAIMEYLGNGVTGYGWHISELVIYDEPKELDWFRKPIDCHKKDCTGCWDCEIRKAPQSWCYVEEVSA